MREAKSLILNCYAAALNLTVISMISITGELPLLSQRFKVGTNALGTYSTQSN